MRIFLLVPAFSLVLSIAAFAQQKDQDEPPVTKTESADAANEVSSEMQAVLDELIDELGSPRFGIRLQAARKLKAAGEQGIETLRRATQTGTQETATQALQILQQHMENADNDGLKMAAKKALQKISADEKNPNSSAARRILSKNADSQSMQNRQFPRLPLMVPGNIRGAAMRVQVQNKNGKLRIQVEKNGQKTSITEVENGIQVEKKDAKGKSSKNTYKNVEELKQKDKDAHQIFEQYKKVGGGIQIQLKANARPLQLNARPKKIADPNPNAPKPEKLQNMQLQMLKRHREMMELQLRNMRDNIENSVPKEHRKQLEDQLKKQREMMNRSLLELEQKLKKQEPADGKQTEQPEATNPEGDKPGKEKRGDSGKTPIEVKTPEQKLIET